MVLVAFLLVNALNFHLSLVLASVDGAHKLQVTMIVTTSELS